jgi:hypothetical protein
MNADRIKEKADCVEQEERRYGGPKYEGVPQTPTPDARNPNREEA